MNPDPINEQIVEEEPRKAEDEAVIEERKSAIASAEKITMDVEIRALDTEDGSIRIGGYAATFNQEATGLNFREVIAPGAFTRTLQTGNPVFLLVNHDMGELPLAATQSGTLQLSEDRIGLRMEADLDPSNPRAAEVASALRRGDVNKMSFAFTVAENGQTREEGLRTLTDLDLYEVSVVTLPAYDSTTVGMRSAQDDLELAKRKLAIKRNQHSLRSKRKA
jgi:HK97 family phage prohead protease